MKKTILLCLVTFSSLITRADVFDEVVSALKAANAKEVSRYFNANVELTILSDEGVYSRQQAELILKSFFNQNAPKSVTVQHKGSSAQGAKFAIALYDCQQGKYRAYIFMKDSGSGMLIHELRIEKD